MLSRIATGMCILYLTGVEFAGGQSSPRPSPAAANWPPPAAALLQSKDAEEQAKLAMELLRRESVFADDAIAAADAGTRLYALLRDKVGKRCGVYTGGGEYLGRLTLGEFVCVDVFRAQHQFGSCIWAITYYQPRDAWKILDIELDEAAARHVSLLATPTSGNDAATLPQPRREHEVPTAIQPVANRFRKYLEEATEGRHDEAFARLIETDWQEQLEPDARIRLERGHRQRLAAAERACGSLIPGSASLVAAVPLGRRTWVGVYAMRRERGYDLLALTVHQAQGTWRIVKIEADDDAKPWIPAAMSVEPQAAK